MPFSWWLTFARRFVPQKSRSQRRSIEKRRRSLALESLEVRDVPAQVTPDSILLNDQSGLTSFGSSGPSGYSPAQIRQAYGFNQVSFGSTPADGSGTTIAIVDAYNDPYIQSDLHNFDQQFGLADPTLSVVNEYGSSSLPGNANSEWGGEISLDVEWAHAIAPGANILLVETNGAYYSDFFQGVSYAASQPGVASVSMSWGGPEWSTESFDDGVFLTPSGHTGVTFVASSGDYGAPVNYPAISPNVLAVGGTSLSINSDGSYSSESGWGGSTGGISQYESQPSYQNGVVTQSTTMRTNPDVSYDANPGSGFAVYDTDGNSASSPWLDYGGTSIGSPQWAALVAIADQGRALSGEAAFTNATLMPKLYDAPGSAFHDITTGSSGGSPNYSAGPGYDLVTGIGTPAANNLIPDLVGSTNTATHFSIGAPSTSTAGGSFSITVTALNSSNQQVGNYTGTVDFTSSDALAGLPSNYTFTASDNGSHTFTVTLKTAGSQSISATDASNSSITGSDSVSVSPGSLSSLSVSGPSNSTAGTSFSETITARDAFGNTVTGYSGTLQFTSSDSSAGLPSSYTFTSSDDGSHTFTIVLKTAGSQTVVATDASDSLHATLSVTVAAGAASLFRLSGPTSATAGTSFSEVVTGYDAYGNVAAGYTGTVQFSSTDAAAVLPGNYTFTSNDAGSHTFTITLKTAGSQTLSVSDAANGSIAGTASVSAAAAEASLFKLSGPSSEVAGTSFSEGVAAYDAYGNLAKGYTGTVHFSSSDASAGLPSNYTFATNDAGSHTFTITLKTAGSQTLTVADTSNNTIDGTTSVSVAAGNASSLSVSGPSTATAGTSFSETITADDAYGNLAKGYTGTLEFTSSDAAAGLPANYTFTANDAGSHTFTITLKTAGSQSVVATDSSNSSLHGSLSVGVAAGAASLFRVSGPTNATAGTSFSEVVAAYDAYGNVASNYTGTVHFTSTDAAAGLPSNYGFTSNDAGSHTFTITLKTAGNQTVSVADASNGAIAGGTSSNVVAGAASSLSVSGPSTATAGASFSETIGAYDAYGNLAKGYTGTVHFTSSDAAAGLPSNYTFAASDAGSHTFSITLKTAGSQSIVATDTANGSLHASLSLGVSAAAASALHVSGPTSSTAGTSFSEVVTAYDAYGNVASGYSGTVQFGSTDAAAGLPSNYTFTTNDAGSHTFAVTLKTAGSQSVTATDAANSSLHATLSVTVTAGAATTLHLSGPSSATAGTSFSEVVSVYDAYGNLASGYTGTVHFTSSDASASLPANYTFTAGDAGSHTFTVTLKTVGSQTVAVADTANGGIAGSTSISVSTGSVSALTLTGPSTATAGSSFNVTLTALDAFGNVDAGYTGTVHFTSSDVAAGLPANYTFTTNDAGSHTFTATLKTAGSESVTATDASNSSLHSTLSVGVSAGTAASFHLSNPSTATAGASFSETATAYDAFGNVAAGYAGTVHFTSSDSNATLPSNYTFTANDAGSHTFTVTLKTAGTETVGIADASDSSIAGSSSVKVSAGSASSLNISDPPSETAGTGFSETVTAYDAFGNVASAYIGTVHFTSTDAAAVLPPNYTFVASDDGSHTFTIVLKTAGNQTIAATDTSNGSLQTNLTVTVVAAAPSTISLSGATSATAGTSFNETATVQDAYGNTVTNYSGTVHFTSSDASAILPANYTYTSNDAGAHTFAIVLKTAGKQSVGIADTTSGSVAGSTSVSVVAGQATSLGASGPSSATAGTSFSETISALDAYGNLATGYTGTIHFASSDSAAVLPANYAFTAKDAGTHTFTITLKTAGSQSITASDTSTGSIAGSASTNVTAGAAAELTLSDPSSATAGASFSEALEAFDAYGNVASGYTGTVHFASSDSAATLPANYTFTASDGGTHTFTIALKTAGSQFVTATDTDDTALEGSTSTTVSPGAVYAFKVSGPTSANVGASFTETVSAVDQYDNVETGYAGTIHFTSTDSLANLPANYTFTPSDEGTHGFTVTLNTPGTQTITATDTGNGSIAGSTTVMVAPSGNDWFKVTGPTTETAGAAGTYTITVMTAQDTVAKGYTGTVHFTSSDAQAVLPANYTFTAANAGIHSFTVTLKTAGAQTVVATDTVSSWIGGTDTVTVTPAAASKLGLAGPSTVAAGVSFTETVTAYDAYGNVATGFRGIMHFSSTGSATLPASYTYTAADAGVHTFKFIEKLVGNQTITATTTVLKAIVGTASVDVTAGAASTFRYTLPTPITAGTSFEFILTAVDAYGNVATGYTGTIHFTSTDPHAILPADYTFSAANGGTAIFTATLAKTGTQTIAATDTATATITAKASIAVNPGAVNSFVVSGYPTSITAGTKANLKVTAYDAYGNVDTTYKGTIHFSSSDLKAVLPANSTLTRGVGTFSVEFETAGSQSVTVTDTKTGASGSETGIVVNPSTATHLVFLQQPTSVAAGSDFAPAITVEVLDKFNNIATNDNANAIALALKGGTAGALLEGTTQVEVVDGIATFSAVAVSKSGSGYTIVATSGSLTSATSASFDVM